MASCPASSEIVANRLATDHPRNDGRWNAFVAGRITNGTAPHMTRRIRCLMTAPEAGELRGVAQFNLPRRRRSGSLTRRFGP